MRKQLVAMMLITSSVLAAPAVAPPDPLSPQFTQDGRLKFPDTYREWVYLTSGLDMSYLERDAMAGHSMFDNVFVNVPAYREFMRTGNWPDGTLLVKEARSAVSKGSISKSGKFQSGDAVEVEVHVKDTKRFGGGWAFFAFGGREPAPQIPAAADCYSCHRDHGLVDTTFVQFYPTLLSVAKQHETALR